MLNQNRGIAIKVVVMQISQASSYDPVESNIQPINIGLIAEPKVASPLLMPVMDPMYFVP